MIHQGRRPQRGGESRCASMMSTMFPARARARALSLVRCCFFLNELARISSTHARPVRNPLVVGRTNERTNERTVKKEGTSACERSGKQNRVLKRGRARNEKEGHKGLTGEVTGERSLISMAVFSQRAVSFTG